MRSRERLEILILLGIGIALLAGCGDDRERRLEAGVKFARAELERTARSPLAAAAYQSHLEEGGNAATYVISCLPEHDPVFTRYVFGRVSQPWTVVIRRGNGPQSFFIEGYAEDLIHPRFVEQIGPGIPQRL
jgi:hypothetical protein